MSPKTRFQIDIQSKLFDRVPVVQILKHHMDQEPHLWKKTKTTLHANCRIFEVNKVRFEHEVRNTSGDFFVMDTPPWVHVVALTQNNEVIMVKQFRFGTENLSWEVPGGLMEKGEAPEIAGARELREETGYVGKSVELIASIAPNPAIQNNLCHIVLIRDAEKVEELEWDEHEEILTKPVPVETVDQWARNGTIFHALSITSVFFLQKYL